MYSKQLFGKEYVFQIDITSFNVKNKESPLAATKIRDVLKMVANLDDVAEGIDTPTKRQHID